MYGHYATFSFPAHTRVASGPESPAPAVATLSVPPATLRAETEPFCSPGAARGVGLIGEVNAVGHANVAVPGPPRFARPNRNGLTCRVRPVPASVRHRPDSASGRLCLQQGNPRAAVPLGRELQASGGRVPATRCRGRPQLQARVQPFPHSRHAGCGAPGPPAPRSRSPSSPDRGGRQASAASRLWTASRTRSKLSAPRQRPRRSSGPARLPARRRESARSGRSAGNEAAGCRTTALNESTKVRTWQEIRPVRSTSSVGCA